MNNQSKNIEMIKLISQGLGNDFLNNVVFVGGSVIGLYSTNPAAPEVRYTEDIDCIVNLAARKNFNDLENELRKKKFQNDMRETAPICRWIYSGVTVDIMPVDSSILGFTNIWYEPGLKNTISYDISNDLTIRILSAPYFLATKIEAHNRRGVNDIRFSHDFEDIVYLLDNRKELIEEVKNSDKEIKNYLNQQFSIFINNPSLDEGIECVLPYGSSSKTLERIKQIFSSIASLG